MIGIFMVISVGVADTISIPDKPQNGAVILAAASMSEIFSQDVEAEEYSISKRGSAEKISLENYKAVRATCRINSITEVQRRLEALIDWRCGKYGLIEINDSISFDQHGTKHILADSKMVEVPSIKVP